MAKDSGRLEPYIAIVGKESLDAYLVVDQQVIDEVPIHNLPYLLVAHLIWCVAHTILFTVYN